MAKEHMDIYDKLIAIASKNVALSKEERETLKDAANMITDFAVSDALRDLKLKKSNEYYCDCEPGMLYACICYTKK